MDISVPLITSVSAILISIIGSYLAYALGKKRLKFDGDVYSNGKTTRDAALVTQYSDAAQSAAESLTKAMTINKTLQEEVSGLKIEISNASLALTEKTLALTERITIVEANLVKAADEISILLAERLVWMKGASQLHAQLEDNKITPCWELPISVERRKVTRTTTHRRRKGD